MKFLTVKESEQPGGQIYFEGGVFVLVGITENKIGVYLDVDFRYSIYSQFYRTKEITN